MPAFYQCRSGQYADDARVEGNDLWADGSEGKDDDEHRENQYQRVLYKSLAFFTG